MVLDYSHSHFGRLQFAPGCGTTRNYKLSFYLIVVHYYKCVPVTKYIEIHGTLLPLGHTKIDFSSKANNTRHMLNENQSL